jgi:Copper transport outer membrane protein, MctB
MFDLRYHVASLAAVFVALLIGILVGVAMSGKVDDAEKRSLETEISLLNAELDSARESRSSVTREQNAIRAFVKNAYPSLIAERLRGKRVAVVFVGTVDAGVRQDVERTLADAGASTPVRMQALKIPLDAEAVESRLNGELRQYRAAGLEELGRALARELVDGGDTPGWNALTSLLVVEKAGSFRRSADGVVVARTVEPQKDETAQFLSGLYGGLADIDVPTIGVETSDVSLSAVEAWSEAGLSTVDDIDTPAGRLALALLLAGSPTGNYGVKESAGDGIVPPVEPLLAPASG